MIAIVCSGHPEKNMTTRLTPLEDGRWEVEVFQHIGAWDMRLPEHNREVDLNGALDELWEAENGAADELVRALGLSEAMIAAAWERHQAKRAQGSHLDPGGHRDIDGRWIDS